MWRLINTTFFLLTYIVSFGQTSILSSGEWFKIEITESGLYKLDRAFLSTLGIPVDNFDPTTLKLYGNGGGGSLPQSNNKERATDLIENPILEFGTSDGSFGSNDYFLFYGNSPDRLEWNGIRWEYEKNPYSDVANYFITYGGNKGMRMIKLENEGVNYPIINHFSHAITHEKDEINLLEKSSGRNWYGHQMSRNLGYSTDLTFKTPDPLDSIIIQLELIGRSDDDGSFEISLNQKIESIIGFTKVIDGTYEIKGTQVYKEIKLPYNTELAQLKINLSDNSAGFLFGYIDRIIVSYNRKLRLNEGQLIFLSPASLANQISTYQIATEDQEVMVLDITQPTKGSIQNHQYSNGLVQFGSNSSKLKKYLIFKGNVFPVPTSLGKIANQNLSASMPKDGLIITHDLFKDQAERLAQFHREHDGLDVKVVSIGQIYNEFSSGMQDITAIRDLIRHYWLKNNSFRYALLFGDCSFDYKDRVPNNTNFIPVYESRNSLDPVLSYSSDDYFGFMENDEGDWIEAGFGDHTLEIGIGRIPVKTNEEAKNVVNKIIRYATSNNTIGEWKNNVTYVVDDGDRNIHVRDAEQLADYLDQSQAQTSHNKLYLDAAIQDVQPNQELAEITRKQFKSVLEYGTFLVNYIGHGNEEKWTEEKVFDLNDISKLTNRFKLPVFVTATCDFGRYDNPNINSPNRTSGGEELLLNPNGGAIALLTTTRPVYSFSNFLVNAAFHSFFFEQIDNEHPRLGDIVRLTKNYSLSGPVNRNFALLGDPMLKLIYPRYNAVIKQINQRDLNNSSDTLSALEKVIISGEIQELDGSLVSTFNGVVQLTIYDRQTQKQTIGQESSPFTYNIRENRLFNGKATITNGMFNISLIVPKNISYRYQSGKISMYAQSHDNTVDASGALPTITIGGSNNIPSTDVTGPKISIFINDSTFQNSGKVGFNSLFIAKIEDESGINATGIGIGKDISLTLSDGKKFILNNYYSADIDTYTKGTITFPLSIAEPGRYSGELKVWDIHNNSSYKTVEFIVSDQPKVRLFNVMNYPNPVAGQTTFSFEHDRIGEELLIKIQIYNVHGSLVSVERFEIDDSSQKIDDLKMVIPNGKFKNGIYLYKLEVTSTIDNAKGEEIKKLVIIN